eukprot:scaffold587_cov339-Pavlova_lutheri.AAC.18
MNPSSAVSAPRPMKCGQQPGKKQVWMKCASRGYCRQPSRRAPRWDRDQGKNNGLAVIFERRSLDEGCRFADKMQNSAA